MATAIICLPFSLGYAEAHDTALIPVGESVKVGQYALDKGEKVVYSYRANGAMLFAVVAHLDLPGYSKISVPLLADTNMSSQGTFEAPLSPTNGGSWIYEFSITNLGFLSVEVTYSLHKVTLSPWTILLIMLAIVVPVVVIFLAYVMSKHAR